MVYMEPESNELTRMGGYLENEFGWNAPQEHFAKPMFDMARSIEDYKRYYDVVVLGDSFSENQSHGWQNYFARESGLSVITFRLGRVKPDDILNSQVYRKQPPKLFIYQIVERNIINRHKKCANDTETGETHFQPGPIPISRVSAKVTAKYRNKSRDTIVRGLALVGVSVPVFFLGMLMQYFISYQLSNALGFQTFPAAGYKNMEYPDPPFVTGFRIIDSLISGQIYLITDYLWHIILPIVCLSFITLAGITRQSRSSMLEVLEQDYVRTARAKGCKEKDVINSHALRNSLIPTITVIGLSFAGLLSGAVLTETTFNLNGVGDLLIAAITGLDYWVLSAVVFIITIMFVALNLITDILYAMLDPRIVY